VRVATFNLLSGRSPGAAFDQDRFTAAVRSLDADLLALQEVDRDQERSGGADLAALAAAATGAATWRFEPTLVGPPGRWVPASTGATGPAYGIAFVSRHPVTSWDVVRLGRLPGDEPRAAMVAAVETPAGPWTVVSTHLSWLRPSCHLQLLSLRRLVRRCTGPVLLLGDLNQGRATATRLSGLRPLATGATYPAHAPRLQLDHVLADRAWTTVAGGPERLPVSDHRAMVVELDLADRGA
jgi:endonuclease/exonuclease/phosphatase family metal-dependent hydrolase